MKKRISLFIPIMLILSVLILSAFVFAQQNQNTTDAVNQGNSDSQGLGQTISQRVKAGIYTNEQGEQIRVSELAQNRIRLNVGNVSVDCDCSLTEEQIQNKTRLKMQLSNGRNAEIKIMPDTASERALERLRLKVCSEENNCTIELKETGKGNETRAS